MNKLIKSKFINLKVLMIFLILVTSMLLVSSICFNRAIANTGTENSNDDTEQLIDSEHDISSSDDSFGSDAEKQFADSDNSAGNLKDKPFLVTINSNYSDAGGTGKVAYRSSGGKKDYYEGDTIDLTPPVEFDSCYVFTNLNYLYFKFLDVSGRKVEMNCLQIIIPENNDYVATSATSSTDNNGNINVFINYNKTDVTKDFYYSDLIEKYDPATEEEFPLKNATVTFLDNNCNVIAESNTNDYGLVQLNFDYDKIKASKNVTLFLHDKSSDPQIVYSLQPSIYDTDSEISSYNYDENNRCFTIDENKVEWYGIPSNLWSVKMNCASECFSHFKLSMEVPGWLHREVVCSDIFMSSYTGPYGTLFSMIPEWEVKENGILHGEITVGTQTASYDIAPVLKETNEQFTYYKTADGDIYNVGDIIEGEFSEDNRFEAEAVFDETAKIITLKGHVVDEAGNGIDGATVNFVSDNDLSKCNLKNPEPVVTSNGGYFEFPNFDTALLPGQIIVAKEGYTFNAQHITKDDIHESEGELFINVNVVSTSEPASGDVTEGGSAQTGDCVPLATVALILIVSAIGVAFASQKRKFN